MQHGNLASAKLPADPLSVAAIMLAKWLNPSKAPTAKSKDKELITLDGPAVFKEVSLAK
tara:strand:- start:397 stop:573 length:177 start_codon:yes stop_codon:yes gene_type:complete